MSQHKEEKLKRYRWSTLVRTPKGTPHSESVVAMKNGGRALGSMLATVVSE